MEITETGSFSSLARIVFLHSAFGRPGEWSQKVSEAEVPKSEFLAWTEIRMDIRRVITDITNENSEAMILKLPAVRRLPKRRFLPEFTSKRVAMMTNVPRPPAIRRLPIRRFLPEFTSKRVKMMTNVPRPPTIRRLPVRRFLPDFPSKRASKIVTAPISPAIRRLPIRRFLPDFPSKRVAKMATAPRLPGIRRLPTRRFLPDFPSKRASKMVTVPRVPAVRRLPTRRFLPDFPSKRVAKIPTVPMLPAIRRLPIRRFLSELPSKRESKTPKIPTPDFVPLEKQESEVGDHQPILQHDVETIPRQRPGIRRLPRCRFLPNFPSKQRKRVAKATPVPLPHPECTSFEDREWDEVFFSSVPFVVKTISKFQPHSDRCLCTDCVEPEESFDIENLFSDTPLSFQAELDAMMLELDKGKSGQHNPTKPPEAPESWGTRPEGLFDKIDEKLEQSRETTTKPEAVMRSERTKAIYEEDTIVMNIDEDEDDDSGLETMSAEQFSFGMLRLYNFLDDID